MKIRLEQIQYMKDLNHFESIVMFVISHKDRDFTYYDEKENVKRSKFVDALEKNQYLANKQKLIFFNLFSSQVKIKENFLIGFACTDFETGQQFPPLGNENGHQYIKFLCNAINDSSINYVTDVLENVKLQSYKDIERVFVSVNGEKKRLMLKSSYENRLTKNFTFK